MSSFRILFATDTGSDAMIIEAGSKREARAIFSRQHPSLCILGVVLVPD